MRWVLAVAAVVCLQALALGQAMADRAPANAFLYIGFKGTDALAKPYEASRLRPVLESTDLQRLVSKPFHDRLANVFNMTQPELADAWPGLVESAKQMSRFPTSLWIGPDGSRLSFALVSDAGGEAQALATQIRSAIGKMPLDVLQNGNIVSIVPRGAQPSDGATLASAERFKSAMQQIDGEGAVVAFVNVEQILSANLRPDQKQTVASLGLDGIDAAAVSANFAGSDWRTRAFVAMTGERRGLAALFAGKPLSDDTLKLIPKTAATASAGYVDLAALLAEIRATVARAVPNGAQQFDRGLSMVNSNLGMDVQTDLLPPLGTEWVTYTDASVGGTQAFGTVVANRLKDPDKAQQALNRLQQKLVTLARAGAETQQMRIPVVVTDHKGIKIQSIGLPFITPSWTIHEGVLYVALFPQPIMAAADHVTAGAPSLAEAPTIVAWRKEHNANPMSINYIDLPQVSRSGYGMLMVVSRYIGLMDLMMGVETPPVAAPPLTVLLQHGAPTLRTTWSDDAGWHLTTTEPFPGALMAGAVMSTDMMTMQASMATSILLPSLARGREKANQVKCASNLRQIGQACMLHAMDHQNAFPDTLGELLEQGIGPEVFMCPSRNGSSPPKHAPREQLVAWVNENAHYEYLGKGLKMGGNPEFVTAYERLDAHNQEGANVLFADGHVEFLLAPRWHEIITEALNQQ